jgi:hypothetical protein
MEHISPSDPPHNPRAVDLIDTVVAIFRLALTSWVRGESVDMRDARAAMVNAAADSLHEVEQDVRRELDHD